MLVKYLMIFYIALQLRVNCEVKEDVLLSENESESDNVPLGEDVVDADQQKVKGNELEEEKSCCKPKSKRVVLEDGTDNEKVPCDADAEGKKNKYKNVVLEDGTVLKDVYTGEEEEKFEDAVQTGYKETIFEKSTEVPSNSRYPQNELVHLSGGLFIMGSDKSPIPDDGEAPARKVTLRPFAIDKYEISNGEFAEFVAETKYKTEAELFGTSFVMDYFLSKEETAKISQAVLGADWWLPVVGANWKQPEGKGHNISYRMNHPVVHVSWNDAQAFCRWKGKRLPTEAEWEYACRGGKEKRLFPWGNKFKAYDTYHANIWQGDFPRNNTAKDGYAGTCEVDRFLQNDFQLYNMVGNVWEWVGDWWTTEHLTKHELNPYGPPGGADKVKKGGSFMCHKKYCYRYRCSARSFNSADSSAYNLGFRCAKYTKKKKTNTARKDEL